MKINKITKRFGETPNLEVLIVYRSKSTFYSRRLDTSVAFIENTVLSVIFSGEDIYRLRPKDFNLVPVPHISTRDSTKVQETTKSNTL